MSYYLTDRNTPIIGPFVTKVVEMAQSSDFKHMQEVYKRVSSWFGQYSYKVQFPNTYQDWMVDGYVQELDVPAFSSWLRGLHTLEECLTPPTLLMLPSVGPGNVSINGEAPDIVTAPTTKYKPSGKGKQPETRPKKKGSLRLKLKAQPFDGECRKCKLNGHKAIDCTGGAGSV
jgi:hypothetical protein